MGVGFLFFFFFFNQQVNPEEIIKLPLSSSGLDNLGLFLGLQ